MTLDVEAFQAHMRSRDALSVFKDGEGHLPPEELLARLVATGKAPYRYWREGKGFTIAHFARAMNPGGRGVEPHPEHGYARTDFEVVASRYEATVVDGKALRDPEAEG